MSCSLWYSSHQQSSHHSPQNIIWCFLYHVAIIIILLPRRVSADHKRRKLEHSSPSHSSSVKVSMAWGRLYPFLLSLPEHSLPLHIPAAPKTTEERCHTSVGKASGFPSSSNPWEMAKFPWTSASYFGEMGEKKALTDNKILYIFSIFHIEKKKSIFLLMKAVGVPWQNKNLKKKSISIFLVDFLFLFLLENDIKLN